MPPQNEYLVDRLRADIARLERDIEELSQKSGEVIVAEILLALVCLIVGYCIGVYTS